MMFKDKNKDKNKEKEQAPAVEKQSDIKQLEAELNVLRGELAKKDDCQDRLLRLQAEFDNFRKRSAKERQEFIKYANEGLIFELVGMLDNFERSIKAADQNHDFKLLHQGVDIISRQLHKLLEGKGLKKISSKDEQFDPNIHEAMEVVETDEAKDGVILEEFQPGYMLNDRVIRPAMVKVAKAKKEEPAEGEEESKCHSERPVPSEIEGSEESENLDPSASSRTQDDKDSAHDDKQKLEG
jgi:molecular chaperone GrpE